MNLNSFLIKSNLNIIKRLYATRFPRTKDEFDEILTKPLELPKNPKLNQIAILGEPNSGKSSLVNAIIGFNICGQSNKAHTTRENLRGVYTENNVQIELTDTPGCVTSKHAIKQKLEPNFLKDPDYSCNYANIIAILYDCKKKVKEHKLSPALLKILYKYRDKPSILILTKIDLIEGRIKKQHYLQQLTDKLTGNDSTLRKKKIYGLNKSPIILQQEIEELFKLTEEKEMKENDKINYDFNQIQPLTENQEHWPYFREVFCVSSFDQTGLKELKNYFLKTSYPNPWLYNQNFITDSSPFKILINIIKSKILDNVVGPSPYNIKIKIVDYIVKENNKIEIIALGQGDNNYFIRSLIGYRGKVIYRITEQIRHEFENLFRCNVDFRLDLEYKENENKKLNIDEIKKESGKKIIRFKKAKNKNLI